MGVEAQRKRIRTLMEMTAALKEGRSTHFSITRLTSIKSLCQSPPVAAQFAVYLAERTWAKVNAGTGPQHLTPAEWSQHQALLAQALPRMKNHLQRPTEKTRSALREILPEIEQVQSFTGQYCWGSPIRSIHNRDVLVIEDAVNCLLSPQEASHWAYITARDYTERYNPRYGTGLVPESVPLLEDLLQFWTRPGEEPGGSTVSRGLPPPQARSGCCTGI